MRSPRTMRTATVLVLLLQVAAARGDYASSFAKGLAAIDRGDWSEAVRWLSAAAQDNPTESGSVLIDGTHSKPYLPHYYLGVAYFNMGKCDAARQAWAESGRQGSVSASDLKELEKMSSQCASRASRPAGAARLKTESTQAVPKQAPTPSEAMRQSTLPASLVAAVATYFRGDYTAAARELAQVNYEDPRAAAQAHLFRAAANYSLFVMGGEKEQALESQAAADIRECVRLDPNLRVSARAFSPGFADFFARNKV